MFTTLKKPAVERDRVVIVNGDGTADIATVYDADDQAVYAASGAQEYAIPVGDTKVHSFVGGSGRIYVLGADPEYVQDTKRLAALERSIVLRHVTQFERRVEDAKKMSIKELMLYLLVAILLLAVIFK